jgi:hypothetical protein
LTEGEAIALSDDKVTILFDFDEVINTADNSAGTSGDKIIVDFYLQVLDEAANVDGKSLTTSALATADGTKVSAENIVVVVKEPELAVISVAPDQSGGDAGDIVTYTIHIDHKAPSTSDGFDLVVVATLPETMQIIDTTGEGDTAVTSSNTVATWRLPHLALQADYKVTLAAMILNTMRPEAAGVVCDVSLDYDSYPVALLGAGGRTYNSSLVSSALNIPKQEFDLQLATSTLGDTADLFATVGEVLYFQGTVTLPELTMTLDVAATLPTGLGFLNASVFAIGSQITGSALAEGEAVAVSVDKTKIEFDFGEVVNAFDVNTGTASDQIIVDYYVQVLDVVKNKDGATLTTSATSGADESDVPASDIIVSLKEPNCQLEVENYLEGEGPVDAGDAIVYTVTLNHTAGSTSAAYDMAVTATVSEYLSILSVDVKSSVDGSFTIASDAKSVVLSSSMISVLEHGITFELATEVQKEVFPNTPGLRMNVTGGYRSAPEVESGTDRYYPVSLDSDAVDVDKLTLEFAVLSTSEPLTNALEIAILETITFRLTARLPEVTTQIILDLELGSGLDSFSIEVQEAVIGNNVNCANDPSGGVIEDTAFVVDFGTCSNFAGNDNTESSLDTIYVDVAVTVLDLEATLADSTFDFSSVLRFNLGSSNAQGIVESDETVTLKVVEPTFALATIEPSKDPFTKALEKMTWTVQASASFGRDVTLVVVIPPFMFFDAAYVTVGDGNFVPIVGIPSSDEDSKAANTPTTVTVQLGAVAINQTISVALNTTVYEDMTPGQEFPSIVATLEWDSHEGAGGRKGTSSADFDKFYIADVRMDASLLSNVGSTSAGNVTIHEGPELELAFLVKGSYRLVVNVQAPLDPTTGKPLAKLVSLNAIVGSNVASPNVVGNIIEGLPTFVNQTTGEAQVDFGPMELSNINVDEIGDDDLVKTQLRYLILDEEHVAHNDYGDFIIIATYAGFTITDTIPLVIIEPEVTFSTGISVANDYELQGGDTVELEAVITASDLDGRSGAHDLVVAFGMNEFDPASLSVTESLIDGVAAPAATTQAGTVSVDTLLPGQTWRLKWVVNVSMEISAGSNFVLEIGLNYDSFPGKDSRQQPGRHYVLNPEAYPLKVKDVAAAKLDISDTSPQFAGGTTSDAVVGEELIYEVQFSIPRGKVASSQLVLTLPSYQASLGSPSIQATKLTQNVTVFSVAGDVALQPPTTTTSADGITITVVLGDITRSGYGPEAPTDGLIILSFAAIVTNDLLTNIAGRSHTVSGVFTSQYGKPNTMTKKYTVREPTIIDSFETLSKAWDAGDKVVVAHVLSNGDGSSSPGYTVGVDINLPEGVEFDQMNGAIMRVPAGTLSAEHLACALSGEALAKTGPCSTLAPQITVVDSANATAYLTSTTARTEVYEIDLQHSVVVIFTVTVKQSIGPAEEMAVKSQCGWASNPGETVRRLYPVGGVTVRTATITTKPVASVAFELSSFSGTGKHVAENDLAVGESVVVSIQMAFPEATYGQTDVKIIFEGPDGAVPAMSLKAFSGSTPGTSLSISNPGFEQVENGAIVSYTQLTNTFDNIDNQEDVLTIQIKVQVDPDTPIPAVGSVHLLKIQVVAANNATTEARQEFVIAGPQLDGSADVYADFTGEFQMLHFDLDLFHAINISSDDAFDLNVALSVSGTANHNVYEMNGMTSTTTTSITSTSTTSVTETTTTTIGASGSGDFESGDGLVVPPTSAAPTAPPGISDGNNITTDIIGEVFDVVTTSFVTQDSLATGETTSFSAIVIVLPGQEASETVCIEMNVSYSAPSPGNMNDPARYTAPSVSVCWGWTTATTTQTSTATSTPTITGTSTPTTTEEYDSGSGSGSGNGLQDNKDKGGMSSGAIGGTITGVLLVLAVLTIAVAMLIQKRKEEDEAMFGTKMPARVSTFGNYASANEFDTLKKGNRTSEYMSASGLGEGIYGANLDGEDVYSNNNRPGEGAVYDQGEGGDNEDVYGLANHGDGPDGKGGARRGTAMYDVGSEPGPATYDDGAERTDEGVYGLSRPVRKSSDDGDVYANKSAVQQRTKGDEGAYSNNRDLRDGDRRTTKWESGRSALEAVYGLKDGDDDPVYGLRDSEKPGDEDDPVYGLNTKRRSDSGDVYANRDNVGRRGSNNDAVYGLGARASVGSDRGGGGDNPDVYNVAAANSKAATVYSVAASGNTVAETALDDLLPPPPADGNGDVYENRSKVAQSPERNLSFVRGSVHAGNEGTMAAARAAIAEAGSEPSKEEEKFVLAENPMPRSGQLSFVKGSVHRPSVDEPAEIIGGAPEVVEEDFAELDFNTTNMDTLERSAFSEMRREVFGEEETLKRRESTELHDDLPPPPMDDDDTFGGSARAPRPLSNWDNNALDAASSQWNDQGPDDGEDAWAEAAGPGRGVSRRTVEELTSFTPLTLDGALGSDQTIDEMHDPNMSGIGGKGLRPMLPLPGGDGDYGGGGDADNVHGMNDDAIRAAIASAAAATEGGRASNQRGGPGADEGEGYMDFPEPDEQEHSPAKEGHQDGEAPRGWSKSRRGSLGGSSGRRTSLTAL